MQININKLWVRIILRKKKTLQERLKRRKNSSDGYVLIYEFVNNLLHSTYERASAAHEITIRQIKRDVGVVQF